MSYDIRLFRPAPGEDPLTMARAEDDEAERKVAEPDEAKDALNHKVASALIAANPFLRPAAFDYEVLARRDRTSVEVAQRKYRHIELNGPDDGNGIQIQLFDDEAFVSLPYWHAGAEADATFKEVWQYLRIIQRETGYVAYDPQLDVLVDLSQDHGQALRIYTGTRAAVMRELPITFPSRRAQPKKKWWQFW